MTTKVRKNRSVFRRCAAALMLAGALATAVRLPAFEQVKLAMERALEERVGYALSKLIDPDQFLVIVRVDPYTVDELKAKSKSGGAAVSGSQFVLPGIPERQKIDNFAALKSEVAKWAQQTSRRFTPAEIDDIAEYLNQSHYRVAK